MYKGTYFSKTVQGLALAALAVIIFYPAISGTAINVRDLWGFSDISAGGDFSFSTWLALLLSAGDSGALNVLSANFLRSCSFFAFICLLVLPGSWPKHLKWLFLGMSVFAVLGLASALLGTSPYESTIAWGNDAAAVCCFITASTLAYRFQKKKQLYWFFGVLALVAVICMVWAWAIFLNNIDGNPAMYSTFYNQNIFASWLLLSVPMAALAWFKAEPISWRNGQLWKWGAFLAATLVTLFFGYNRTAWAVAAYVLLLAFTLDRKTSWRRQLVQIFLAGVIIVATVGNITWFMRGQILKSVLSGATMVAALIGLVGWKQHWNRKWLISLFILAGMSGIFFAFLGTQNNMGTSFVNERVQQFTKGGDPSGSSRLEFYRAAWKIALDHPWIGVGPQGFVRYYPLYQQDGRWYSRYTHCLTFDLLCAYGFINTALFFVCLGYGLWLAWRFWQRDNEESAYWRLGLTLGGLAMFLHAQSDGDAHFLSLPLAASLLAGMVLGTPVVSEEGNQAPGETESETEHSALYIRPSLLRQYIITAFIATLLVMNVRCTIGDYYGTYARYCQDHFQFEFALDYYRSAVENSPFNSNYRCRLVTTLISLGVSPKDEKMALEIDENSLAAVLMDPHNMICYSVRGQALEYMGDWEGAIEHYQRALDLDPYNSANNYFDMVRALVHLGHNDVAETCWDSCLEHVVSGRLRTIAESPYNKTPEALVGYEILLRKLDPSHEWYWELIQILEKNGLEPIFIDYLRGLGHMTLALNLQKEGKKEQSDAAFAEARVYINKVAAKDPSYKAIPALMRQLP